jgi:hypothetical protein
VGERTVRFRLIIIYSIILQWAILTTITGWFITLAVYGIPHYYKAKEKWKIFYANTGYVV